MGLKIGVLRVDAKVEKKVIPEFEKLPAIGPVDERPEVLGPENNGVHPVRRCRNNRDMLIKGIDDFKKALANLLHKPGHVKGGDIGSSGCGDDDLMGSFHFRYIFRHSEAAEIKRDI